MLGKLYLMIYCTHVIRMDWFSRSESQIYIPHIIPMFIFLLSKNLFDAHFKCVSKFKPLELLSHQWAWTDRHYQRWRRCEVVPQSSSCLCMLLHIQHHTQEATCKDSQQRKTTQSRSVKVDQKKHYYTDIYHGSLSQLNIFILYTS